MHPVNASGLHERLLDCVTQAVIVTDLDGRVTYWNRYAETLYGWPAHEAIGRNILELTPSEQMRPAAEEILAKLRRGESWQGEFEVKDRSGRTFTVAVNDIAILDDGGKLVAIAGISSDVSDFREVERLVRSGTIERDVEIARHARQQSALAQAGQIALGSASLNFIFAQHSHIVCDILGTDCCAIYKCGEGGDLLLVGGEGWREMAIGTERVDGGLHSQAGYTLQVLEPVIAPDLLHETRFTSSPALVREGIVSSVTVIIDGGADQPWGVIGAHARTRRQFSESDAGFLRALAATLSQAIERRRAEVELRVRALQQSAIAELGHLVLTDDVAQPTFDRACELIMSGLGVEFSQYLESDNDGASLHLRAGQSWLQQVPDPIPMDVTQAGLAMRTGKPVVIVDYNKETRFDATLLFTSQGIRSGVAVPVIGRNRKFGVITAQTRTPKTFIAGDVHFMESIAAVLADALTREVAKRELIDSEMRYRSVVEGASEIIFSVSPEGIITSANPAFEAITGWRCEEWINKPFDGLIMPAYLDEIRELVASIFREPRSVRTEGHLRGKSGAEILVAAAVSPKIVKGEVVEIYGFARDVTEERRLEAERNRVTREMQLILDSTDEGIYATDVEGRCTLVNRSAAKLLSASPDWLLGSDIHALIHPRSPGASPEQSDACAIVDVLRTARSHSSRDDIFCRADGSPFPVEYTVSPIIDRGDIKGSVVAFNDISTRRKLESKLEQANRLSSLGRLAATVAHEFNNVLMGISPFAEVLKRETLSERGQTAVEQISRSVKRGKRITEDILRFTQPSEPVLAPFDAAAWLQSIALEARSVVGPKYQIAVDVPADPVRIIGDAGQLHQSVINLILNSRDAMPGGGHISVRIDRMEGETEFTGIEHPERYAHFVVEDTGEGISAETLRHIFEPLFTTKKNGTGLGLSVARHVVTRHGGEIFVESTVGVGTRFHLFIPLAELGTSRAKGDSAPQPGLNIRKYRRVLIVEDERPVAAGLAALLELEGIDVKLVEHGRDVLPAVSEWKPDAIVLDIGLPDMDGTKVFESVARVHPHMPVVFSSGHGDESQLERQTARPNVAFLLKPYDIETLLAALDRVVT